MSSSVDALLAPIYAAIQTAKDSEAMVSSSDNSKTIALGQIYAQEFQMQQMAMDRELQNAAKLEQDMEGFDTKLQIGKLQYDQQMTADENQHIEKIAQAHADLQQLEMSRSAPQAELPPPEFV